MSPQQELFSALLVRLRENWPDRVFDGDLPPEGTPYPFIFLGETQEIADFRAKGAFFGRTSVTIHVWQNDSRQRGTLSEMLFQIRRIARQIDSTESNGWCFSGADEEILSDNSTKEPLMHGLLCFEYKHWRKK